MSNTRDVRESRIVKSYTKRVNTTGSTPQAKSALAVGHPIVRPEAREHPAPKEADLQHRALDLVANHFRAFSYNGHPHHFKLIVEPELPRPRVVLEFQFEQILLPVLQCDLLPAEELGA